MNKIAVIDLGTNTCNLLIAEYDGQAYRVLWQGKEIVRLGKGGIHKNLILADGTERAVSAIKKHQERIAAYQIENVRAIATSAVRDAANKAAFCTEILQQTGISLEVISGDQEALLIYQGAMLALGTQSAESLILDIGGGSNEFIWCTPEQIFWEHSFPLGMARIIERFSFSNPVTPDEVQTVRMYFGQQMTELWQTLAGRDIQQLIGCSGAFDTIADLIDHTEPGTKARSSQVISVEEFHAVYQLLINSTTEERTAMKEMEPVRVDMIIPAVILIDLVLEKLNISRIVQTDFALREGVLFDEMRK